MKKVSIELPYLEVSFTIISEEVFEKTFLTPFGVIDILIKRKYFPESRTYRYEVSLNTDPDGRFCNDYRVSKDFRKAVEDFIKFLMKEEFDCFLPFCSNSDFVIKV